MKILSLSPQPRAVVSQNRAALVDADERRARLEAIMASGFRCEGCGTLAWSKQKLAEFELRDRPNEPERPYVFCNGCAERYDVRLAQRSGRTHEGI